MRRHVKVERQCAGKQALPFNDSTHSTRKVQASAVKENPYPGGFMTKRAQVTLVHGAWADGSCWSKVILLLQAQGITVTAAQIPLTSLTDDIAVTKRLLSMHKESTVLVGHSYG